MRPEKDARPVPDLVLERYRLGELPRSEAEALTRRLLTDAELRRRLEALGRSDEELQRARLARRLADGVRARLEVRGSAAADRPVTWVKPWAWPAALAAAVAVLALSTRAFGPSPAVPGVEPGHVEPAADRIKGLRPAVALFRKTPDGSEALADGDLARKGDLIRVGYRAAGRGFGVIVSVDGRGSVTLHLPPQGPVASALGTGDTVLLDQAYELDDAPRGERFFLVTAASPFEVSTVLLAARRAARGGAPPTLLPLPPTLEQSAFLLAKE